MTQDKLVDRLSKLDTCAVSDALDSLELKGVVTSLKSVSVRKKIVGRIVTVKLVSAEQGSSKRHLGTAAVETASNGDVIVVEHGRDDVAGWGGNLCVAAVQRNISGVIIDGACRDVDEMCDLEFPVYARSQVPTTARGRIVEQSFNERIVIADVEVDPSDLVIADGSGIAFIQSSQAEVVISTAERIVEKEAAMAKAIREGKPVSEVMGKDYETMLKRD
ncbi:RraA family protein [Alkalihalobacillus deserti]|uniref:RraA family protein n=1 Tax=Alkalihalobacillus deserti TaxID=2879466 RepID=UPI001D1383FC|nr:RraA family protein [Alkalihalobacillus deserti]